MMLADLIEKIKSGVISINFIGADNKILAKGSGFMSNGLLVTNNHVFLGPANSRVWLRTYDISAPGITLDVETFKGSLKSGSTEDQYDFAILDIPQLRELKLYDFSLRSPSNLRIGDDICLLGYPLDHTNLTCHSGIISSFFDSNNTRFIQVDASVNSSNSGGPLIDPKTAEVIGIITRKATGLTNIIKELKTSAEQNILIIQASRASGGLITMMGINPHEVLEVSQLQALQLIKEIERSANVGIGYAVSCEHLLDDNVFH